MISSKSPTLTPTISWNENGGAQFGPDLTAEGSPTTRLHTNVFLTKLFFHGIIPTHPPMQQPRPQSANVPNKTGQELA